MRHDQLRTYDRASSVVFLKTKEAFGGLSNMAGGFPLCVNGMRILTSEALYQACRFPHLPEVQSEIIAQKSPMTAKMKSKPHRKDSRSDWDRVRVRIMRWCLRVKLAQNWGSFSLLLLETGDRPIVEQSRKDSFWGAKPTNDDTLVGMNVLGRLLMELRDVAKNESVESLLHIEPLDIPKFLLDGEPIWAVEPTGLTIEDYSATVVVTKEEQIQGSLFDDRETAATPRVDIMRTRPSQAGQDDIKPYPAMKRSGVKWLGEVPKHWTEKRAKYFYREVDERSTTGSEELMSVSHKTGVTSRKKSVTMFMAESNVGHKICRPDDIAINTMWAFMGALGVSRQVGLVSPSYGVYRPTHPGELMPEYIDRLLRIDSYTSEYMCRSTGINSSRLRLYPDEFLRIPILCPPLSEQAAISRYLDHVDRRVRRLVRAKRKLIALLIEERKNATLEAIQSPATGSHRLDVVADLIKRPIDGTADETCTPIGLYNRGRGIFKKESRRGDDLGDSDFFWIEEGDLVISGQFAWEGAIALASGAEAGCVASHRYPIVRGKPDVLDSKFLLAFFQTDWGQLLLNHHSRGAAGRNRPLNARTLMKEKISVPPLQVQQTIAEMLQRESLVRQEVDQWSRLLNEYHTRLIADVVTGKVDVRNAVAALPEIDRLDADDRSDAACGAEVAADLDVLDDIPVEVQE